MHSEHFWFLFQFMREVEEGMTKDEMKQVMIEKAINLKLFCDYVVSCSYGDIVLIICMLHDYVKMLDGIRDDIQWKAYYRIKFVEMADRLAEQIEYDYDAAVERCRKKQEKEERDSDIGEEAMTLMVKRDDARKKESRKEVQGKNESNSKVPRE